MLPLQFSYEIFLFGEERGPKKAAVFVGGITAFRVVLLFVLGLIFVGVTAFLTEKIVDLAQFAQRFLFFLGREITSGHRVLLDSLLVLSGLLLFLEAYLYYKRSKADRPVEEVPEEAKRGRSYRSLFFLGIGWMTISLNQWLFTLTAANLVLVITNAPLGRVLLSLFFLLLASLLILAPFVIYLFKPQSTTAILNRLNGMINSTLSYMVMALMIAGGIYLIWLGARGLLHYAGVSVPI